jgi:hypothetical protein
MACEHTGPADDSKGLASLDSGALVRADCDKFVRAFHQFGQCPICWPKGAKKK